MTTIFIDELKSSVNKFPDKPGVYKFVDGVGVVIYVGKAKNLKKRVQSYFLNKHENTKTSVLVNKARLVEYIVVNSEEDALILENSLIKKLQPRYNILLKDDKTFPYVCIKNEPFPRVFLTRKKILDGSLYFGPYTSVVTVKYLIDFLNKTFKIRTCTLFLNEKNINQKKFSVCLQFHLNNCKGSCVGLIEEKEYLIGIDQIKKILNGDFSYVIKDLSLKMTQMSQLLFFEKAEFLKNQIEQIHNLQTKTVVVSEKIFDTDVYSYFRENDFVCVNFLKINKGSIVQSYTLDIKISLDEDDSDVLSFGINELRTRFESKSSEIIVPFNPQFLIENCKYIIPKRGDKKTLLEISEKNLKYHILERKKSVVNITSDKKNSNIISKLQSDLRLNSLPLWIECFDNSNLQGTNPVASCVVFKNAKPSKIDYRHFNIKTVEGANDFASMYEVVYRRYSRLKTEGLGLPDLIVIDGGKGQLGFALKALVDLSLDNKIAIISIAKKLEEIFRPNDQYPLYLDKHSSSLKLIQQLRDEAHRFGISFHRDKRSKATIHSFLDNIKGIGSLTKSKLIKEFKSIERIKKAEYMDIVNLIGYQKAELLKEHFEAK